MLTVKGILLLLGTFVLFTERSISADLEKKEWWETTLVYQIWPRAYQDTDGNGEGDLQGIISHLDYLAELGIETIWLNPIYSSPLVDSGYDVSNHTNIDPIFGNLDDFDELIEAAHNRSLKVIIDIVPNHSSDEHKWFNASVYSTEPYTDYYIWANGTVNDDGTNVAPNNWVSIYNASEEGSAWTWSEIRQQWYYHKFHTSQPDLNLRNENVVEELLDIFDFWLEKNVDGFHIGAATYFFEDDNLRDEPPDNSGLYTFSLAENAALLYTFRAHVDDWVKANNATSKLLVAESYGSDESLITYYGNETHAGISPLNFRFISKIARNSNASYIKDTLEEWLKLLPQNASTNWVLSNHDNSRVTSRIGLNRVDGLNMLSLLLPGQAYTYYGDEIAMLDTSISWNETIDSLACSQSEDTYENYSRDPARTPMQWDKSISANFSTNVTTFLPVNGDYDTRNVAVQLNNSRSNLHTYKALAALRKNPIFSHGDYQLAALNNDRILVLKRSLIGYPSHIILTNVGLLKQTVNLTTLYPEVADNLIVVIASNNAVINSPTVSRDAVELSANAALVLSDRLEESTTETTTESHTTDSTTSIPPTVILGNEVIEGNLEWWQTAVIYQIYPKSFQDSDGDGVGDLQGIISRLDHLVKSGVDGFWLNCVYPSPQRDSGYDIANYTDIDPLFGSMQDFEELVESAHALGLKVILDYVPNHSSAQHEWFQNSILKIAPYTDYYVWKNGIPSANGTVPPNNWLSAFGGPAWTWNEERQQYYLHKFESSQPDLNFRNPAVIQEMSNVLTFWLDKGVDGFRLDAVSQLYEEANFLNEPINPNAGDDVLETDYNYLSHIYTRDVNETYELVYKWRALLDDYANKTDGIRRPLIVETSSTLDKVFRYFGNDTHKGAQLPFNFGLILNLTESSKATEYIQNIVPWLNEISTGRIPNWVLGNHDRSRVASRFGLNLADGLNMLILLLPGTAFTYYGEEIAMLDTNISWEDTLDPLACNAGPERFQLFTRDPARTPYQWNGNTSAGFSTNTSTWLPVNSNYIIRNLDYQAESWRSVYKTYKSLVNVKQSETIRRGSTKLLSLQDDTVLVFIRELKNSDTYAVFINLDLQRITVDISSLNVFPTGVADIYIASANSIANSGISIDVKRVPLSANAALVLRSQRLPDTTTTVVVTTTTTTKTTAETMTTTEIPKEDENSRAETAMSSTFLFAIVAWLII